MSRRGFLGVAAAGLAGAVLAPGIQLIEIAQAATPGAGASAKVRWGMLVDTSKCAEGCTDCVDACNTEIGLAPASPAAATPRKPRRLTSSLPARPWPTCSSGTRSSRSAPRRSCGS